VQFDVKYSQCWRKIKCPARTIRNLRELGYSTRGVVLADIDKPGEAKSIVPESRGEVMHDLICTPGALKAINADLVVPTVSAAIAFYDRMSEKPDEGADYARGSAAPVSADELL